MNIRRAYKYRLYPTVEATKWLEGQIETHRRIYNRLLELRNHIYEVFGESTDSFEEQRMLTRIRKRCKFLSSCDLSSLGATLQRLDDSFQRFFKGLGKFPRFKGKQHFNSITFQPGRVRKAVGNPRQWDGKGFRLLPPMNGERNARVRFTVMDKDCPKPNHIVGHIECGMRWHRDMPAGTKIKTASVKREGSHWFVVFSCEAPQPSPSCGTGAVGIDVGLKTFVTTSNNEQMGDSRFLEDRLRQLRVINRAISRCTRGSSRYKKRCLERQNLMRKIADMRKTSHCTVAARLFDKYEEVVAEALNIRGLARGRLSRRVLDAAWGSFLLRLKTAAETRGGRVTDVNPAGTSQTCSCCGTVVQKDLSIRVHDCPNCGLRIDRDHNAAINILARKDMPKQKKARKTIRKRKTSP